MPSIPTASASLRQDVPPAPGQPGAGARPTPRTTRLRALIEAPPLLVLPGVYDAFLARCVEQAGFQALYMTGAGVSHSLLGQPDLGLASFSEMVDRAWKIADAVDIPLLADADNGYGNALNVIRTIRAYEQAGLAGCHLEDQQLPKRCGHFEGKLLIPLNEMLGKLKAALDTRRDADFILIARTDARSVEGLNAAIERAQAFCEAGVDAVFVESPRNEAEMAQITASIAKPLLINMVEYGLTPILPAQRLQALGFALAIHPGALGRFISKQVGPFLARFHEEGSTLSQLAKMTDFQAQNAIVGLPQWLELARRYQS